MQGFKGFRVYPKAPKRVMGSLGEGFGFGGLGFRISLRGSRSNRVARKL